MGQMSDKGRRTSDTIKRFAPIASDTNPETAVQTWWDVTPGAREESSGRGGRPITGGNLSAAGLGGDRFQRMFPELP